MSPTAVTTSLRSLTLNVALVRAFRRSPIDFLDVLAAAHRPGVPLRMGPERVLLVTDAAEVWELLTTHARRTGKGRGLVRARLLLGDGLLTSEGDTHRRHRRVLQPAFHPQSVLGYRAHFARAAECVAGQWSDGKDVDLVADMAAMTLSGTASALFGSELSGRAPQITHALTQMLAGFRLAMAPGAPALLRSPLPAARRMRAATTDLERVVGDLVRSRAHGDGPVAPVLDLLAGQPELTDTDVRDEVMTLLLAGHETTAMALTWALAAIDQHPAVREELEAEWDALASTEPASSTPSTDSTAEPELSEALPLTMAVLAETLRLWPPSWMFTRRVLEPLALGGHDIDTGTLCLVSPALLHRDPRWWDEPERFRPERWLRSSPGGTRRFDPKAPGAPRGAYLPFGAGPRMCIGEQFAWCEAATMLAVLGRRWRLRLHEAPLVAGRSSMTLRPRGLVRATTTRRTRSPARSSGST